MSYYTIGAVAPTGTLSELRRQAKESAMAAQKPYIGVAFGANGQEMAAADTKESVMEWYGAIVDRKDVYYAVVWAGKEIDEEYIGEIPISTSRPRTFWPWIAGGVAGVVGLGVLAGRKRRAG
jgi:hypothetical protein